MSEKFVDTENKIKKQDVHNSSETSSPTSHNINFELQ